MGGCRRARGASGRVRRRGAGRALLLDGTGVSMAANKVPGVRAALCGDAETARGARRWNDANILCLSLRATSEVLAGEILDACGSQRSPIPQRRRTSRRFATWTVGGRRHSLRADGGGTRFAKLLCAEEGTLKKYPNARITESH